GKRERRMRAEAAVWVAEGTHGRSERERAAERVVIDRVLRELRDHARIVKGAGAAANAGLVVAEWIPGEPQTRREIVVVSAGAARRESLVARKGEPERGVDIYRRDTLGGKVLRAEEFQPAADFIPRAVGLVAQTEG